MKYNILYFLICLHSFTWAQKSGNLHYQQTEIKNNVAVAEVDDQAITLSVSGLLNAKAEEYVAFFHVMQVGETAESTDALMTFRIRKFKNALIKSGIDTTAVHTDMISFVPKYNYNLMKTLFSKTYNEVLEGFELQKNVIIRYENAFSLDAILTAAAGAEIYDLVKVDYFLKDVKKLYDQLRFQCLQTLKERIKSYEMLGIKLDTMKKTFVDDFGTILPQQRYGQYQAVARPSMVALKESTGGASLKFRSVELSPSRYYDAVSYEQYDVVVNPVVVEPMVQLTYKIQMKFITNNREETPQNSFWFIGVNGQLQKVDLTNP